MLLLDIPTFLGHLHPLIVHLPIGFLLLAALLDLLAHGKDRGHLREVVPLILLLGFIAAVLSCVFGFFLAGAGDYDGPQLERHKIAGIILAILSGLTYLFRKKSPVRIVTFLLLGLAILVSYTGHLGGGLTHGNDYLSLSMLTETSSGTSHKMPDNPDEALVFEDIVHPILEKKCSQCHQGGKTKGNLSVQTWATLLKGGKHGPAVTPGKLGESELYRRVTLDPSNEKFMPSDGKPPLTKTELSIISWWIEKTNAAVGKKLGEYKDHVQILALLGKKGSSTSLAEPDDTAGAPAQAINPDIPSTLDPFLVDNLRKKGWTIRVMLQKPAMLDLTLPAGSGKSTAQVKDELTGLEKNIVWLNLSGNNFTDAGLAFLKQLSNLEKLRLEKNPLTDAVADDLAGLRHLQAVNLNETKITGAGLARLQKNPAIQRIYTWKTAVRQP